MPNIGRNELCYCGSGLKYKYCHGDVIKQEECKYVMKHRMAELIVEEKLKRGLICEHGVAKGENCTKCKIGD